VSPRKHLVSISASSMQLATLHILHIHSHTDLQLHSPSPLILHRPCSFINMLTVYSNFHSRYCKMCQKEFHHSFRYSSAKTARALLARRIQRQSPINLPQEVNTANWYCFALESTKCMQSLHITKV